MPLLEAQNDSMIPFLTLYDAPVSVLLPLPLLPCCAADSGEELADRTGVADYTHLV